MTTGAAQPTSSSQAPTSWIRPFTARGTRRFRRLTICACIASTFFGALWLLRAHGTLLPIAGPLSSPVIAYLGVLAWVAAASCLVIAPARWHVGGPTLPHVLWRATYPWVVALTTGAYTIGTTLIATGSEQWFGAAVVVPLLLLAAALLGVGRPSSLRVGDPVLPRTFFSDMGLFVACLGAGAAFLAAVVFGFFFFISVPEGGHFAGGAPRILVEQMQNLGGAYEITWFQHGLVFKRTSSG